MNAGLFGICLAFFIAVFRLSPAAFGTDAAQDERLIREIEDNLIAPCCWTQPVSQHPSEVSDRIRREVREMVAAGRSRDEIYDHYVAEYGERILASPRARGFNKLAYILPALALLLGGCLLLILLKRLRAPAPEAAAPAAPDPRYASAVDKEIRELED